MPQDRDTSLFSLCFDDDDDDDDDDDGMNIKKMKAKMQMTMKMTDLYLPSNYWGGIGPGPTDLTV